jgi:signal transduction histidine kinase
VSLRTRITLWHSVTLFVSLAMMGGVFYYELEEDRQALRKGLPVGSYWEETAEFVLYFGLPASVLLLLSGAWFIRRSFLPVARLTEAVERIHLHHLKEQLPRSGTHDELDRLTEVFNAMTTRLQESFRRMREFTLNASHELKTPLTIMRGELETVLRGEECPPNQRELLAGLLDEVNRLAKIVDSLSFLAKADAGRIELKLEPVQLDELVRDIFTDAQVLAGPAGIAVQLSRCDLVVVRGDRHRLRQLLLNLTDNAIKYNQPHGRLEMALTQNTGVAELRIGNTGPGIPPEKLAHVFERFYRGDTAHGTTVEGSGLGLTIARWIVQAHGGTIRLDSRPHEWTTVELRLPATPTAQPAKI